MQVSRAFMEAFSLVHAVFGSSREEIELAKAIARADMPAAERAYFATAAMLNAGWKPSQEDVRGFVARTGYREAA